MPISMTMILGRQFFGQTNRFTAISGLAHYFQFGIVFEYKTQSMTNNTVIVRDQDPKFAHACTSMPEGIWTSNSVPLPGSE